jgi:hypothetical protein
MLDQHVEHSAGKIGKDITPDFVRAWGATLYMDLFVETMLEPAEEVR